MKKISLLILIFLISSYLLSHLCLAAEPSDLLKEARGLYNEGRYKEAIELLEKISQLLPDDPGIYLIYSLIGDCYYEDRQYEKAVDYFNRALTINPKNWKTHYLLGHVYEKMGLFDKALLQYKKILSIEPFNQKTIAKIKSMHSASLNTMFASFIYMLLAAMIPISISYFVERSYRKKEKINLVPIWAKRLNIVTILACWGLCGFVFSMAFSKIFYDDYLIFLFYSKFENVHQITLIITSVIFIFLSFYLVKRSKGTLADIGVEIKNLKKSLYLGLGGCIFIIILWILHFLTFAKGNLSIYNKLGQAISLYKTNLFLLFLSSGIIAPIGEEVFFRGFVYNIFKKRVGILLAFFLTSLLFALWHRELIIFYFFSGMVLIFLYEKDKTLAAPIFAHLLGNIIAILSSLLRI